jgi:hypothetical protein
VVVGHVGIVLGVDLGLSVVEIESGHISPLSGGKLDGTMGVVKAMAGILGGGILGTRSADSDVARPDGGAGRDAGHGWATATEDMREEGRGDERRDERGDSEGELMSFLSSSSIVVVSFLKGEMWSCLGGERARKLAGHWRGKLGQLGGMMMEAGNSL